MRLITVRVLPMTLLATLLLVLLCSRADATSGEERDWACTPLQFTYDTYLGHTVVCDHVPEQQALPGMPDWKAHPSYLKLQFSGYPFPNSLGLGPTIYVFPVEDSYRSLYPDEQSDLWLEHVNALRTVLSNRPTWPTSSWQDGQPMTNPPLLPIINASNIYLAKQKYVAFGRMSGVRYLAQITQQPTLPSQDDTFYIFEGIADNGPVYGGQSFVIAVFPAFLASPPTTLVNADFQTQARLIANTLERANSAAFNPDLRLFDNIITSFKFLYPLPTEDGPGMPISGAGNVFNTYVIMLLIAALITISVGIKLHFANRST